MKRYMRVFVFLTLTLTLIFSSEDLHAQQYKGKKDIEKGSQMAGGTLNFGAENNKNEEVLRGNKDLESYTVGIRPYYGYFIGKNLLVGFFLEYEFSKSNEVTRWEDGLITPTERFESVKENSHGFIVGPRLRYYIPMGKSGRFSLYLETNLGVGYSNGNIEIRNSEGEFREIPSEAFRLELNFRPGVSVFVYRNFALELSMGALGFAAQTEKIGEGESATTKKSADFDLIIDVDLAKVGIGLVGYF